MPNLTFSMRWAEIAYIGRRHDAHALSNATAYQLARAFAFFFELTNLAETNDRKCRRLSS
jgi:phosphoenolpyruvate carboxylase